MSLPRISNFQPARLAQALDARRLTQAATAMLADVSTATLSKWINGQQAPTPAALDRLAAALGLKAEWFTRPVPQRTTPALFRSNALAHVSARKMLRARLEWLQELALACSEFADFPALNVPDFRFERVEEITQADIEGAAEACRAAWRLGRAPIADLTLAAESAGIIVAREHTGIAQIEGLSAWSDELGRPLVHLSADKNNAYRGRFDLGHEIGHLVLHRHIVGSRDSVEIHREMERQAHAFAGALLLPAEALAAAVSLPVTLTSLLAIKARWGISAGAIVMRLKAIGLIDEDETVAIFKHRSRIWGSKSEPGDDGRLPEEPRLLRRTLDLLASEGLILPEGMDAYFGTSWPDIEALACLPRGHFRTAPSSQDGAYGRLRIVRRGAA